MDKESLKSILEQNNYDMDKSINQVAHIFYFAKFISLLNSLEKFLLKSLLRKLKVIFSQKFLNTSLDSEASASVKEITGDLFTCGEASLAHCVSVDLKMGKGLFL